MSDVRAKARTLHEGPAKARTLDEGPPTPMADHRRLRYALAVRKSPALDSLAWKKACNCCCAVSILPAESEVARLRSSCWKGSVDVAPVVDDAAPVVAPVPVVEVEAVLAAAVEAAVEPALVPAAEIVPVVGVAPVLDGALIWANRVVRLA